MKILILTQPLGHNYGGLLQAYALQKYLEQSGHDVETLDRRITLNPLENIKALNPDRVKALLQKIKAKILKEKIPPSKYAPLIAFQDNNLKMSPCIRSDKALCDYVTRKQFDAVVVGSDQVWRPRYSPQLSNFFLDFLDQTKSPAKRISYAASFGTDAWEFSPKETAQCGALLKKFDSVSVREESGIALCETHFGVKARHVVDPTFLIDPEMYRKLILSGGKGGKKERQLTSYILDSSAEKKALVTRIAGTLGLAPCFMEPHKEEKAEEAPLPKIEEWLEAFSDADFVVTDSFHGCVFCILFNKPFLAIGNQGRGLSRFQSLLSSFGLEDRLLLSLEDTGNTLPAKAIDWEQVNTIRQKKAEESKIFLAHALEGKKRETTV